MTRDEIAKIIDPNYPNVYAPTSEATKLIFKNGDVKIGYFQVTNDSNTLEKENKFTFLEYGENMQQFRSTGDFKYVTIINGSEIIDVEYPSYSSVVFNRLKRLKELLEPTNKKIDWELYKNNWVKSTQNLFHIIMYKWLPEHEKEGLVSFSLIPISRSEKTLGDYISSSLEIGLSNQRSLILEPVSGISSNYDGKLDFYLIGNVYKKVSLYRKIGEDGLDNWIIAKSYDFNDHFALNEQSFLKQIDQWLQ